MRRAALILCGSLFVLTGCLSTPAEKEADSNYEKEGARSLDKLNRRLRHLEDGSTRRDRDTDMSTGLPKIERVFSD